MSPSVSATPRRRSSLRVAVGVLSTAWVVATFALICRLLSLALGQWADSYSGSSETTALYAAQSAHAGLWLAALLAGGPVILAVLAWAGGMRKTFIGFLGLAVLLVPAGLAGAAGMWRTLHPSSPPPAAPAHCVEFSGGDSTCPGG